MGNQTSYRAVPPDRPFEYALARGFDAFEWFPDRRPSGQGWAAADLDAALRREIRRRAADADVALSVHAPMPADPLDSGSARGIEESLRLAVDLGATLLNIHLSRSWSLGGFAAAVAPLARRCAGEGLRLAIENTAADGPEAFNELFGPLALAASWPSGTVGMCLDIGHANIFSGTRNDYLGYVDRLGPHVPIAHVHAHENRGDRDSHLPLFSGPAGDDPSGVAGLVSRLQRRAFCGCVILEQWPDPPSMLDRARDGLLGLVDSPPGGGPGAEGPGPGGGCQ